MIKAVGLTKKFGAFTALDALHTEIDRGRVYGLVGPNGSGKSTFLRSIAGIYRPDAGTLTVDGHAVFDTPAVKDRIFLLAEDLFFLPKSTVDDMAAFYAGLYSGFSRERYQQLKARFPIRTDRRISTFSKGMKRQAALLLALASGTDYLLLDEAFDGLDPVVRLLMKKLFAEQVAERGVTVIITGHNLRELEDFCDQIGLLHQGKILFQKELDALKLDFCKVQAAFETPVDWGAAGLEILQKREQGKYVSLLVRGSGEDTMRRIAQLNPLFSEAIPLTLEEVFIGEMEAAGYDYNHFSL